MHKNKVHVETQLSKIGRNPKKYHGMVNTPVFRGSTILFEKVEDIYEIDSHAHTDKTYSRSGTPTVLELQDAMAQLDGVDNCIVTSSGMHAISLVMLSILKNGDHILIPDASYKCTLRFAEEELHKYGIEYSFYLHESTESIAKHIQKNTKMIWLESPSSGLYQIQDIEEIVKIAHKHNIITAIDNTWATPILFKPFMHGIDISVQSLSKYVSGHSDLMLGSITADDKIFPQIYSTFRNHGAIPNPDNCYLALRGLRTLAVRLKRHEESSIKIAQWLQSQPQVHKVLHPALPSSSEYNLWKKYFSGSSGTFGVIVKCKNEKKLYSFINALEIFGIGLSWGGYESLALPYILPKCVRSRYLSEKEYLIRLHIGLENPNDLIVQLGGALKYLDS